MKKTFKFFVMAALACAVGCFTACTSEEGGPVGPEGPVVEGVPTYATFNFTITEGGSGTKAMEGDLTPAENANVNDIRIIIFNSKDTCEANVVKTGIAYTGGSGTTVTDAARSATVKVTSGEKKIFVIANAETNAPLKTALDAIVPHTTLLSAFNKVVDLVGSTATYDPTPYPATAVPTDINAMATFVSRTNGYIMSNAADAYAVKNLIANIDSISSATGTPDGTLGGTPHATNTISIGIQRAVAKAKATYSATAAATPVVSGSPKTDDGTGYIDAATLKYAFTNVNRALYLFQNLGYAAVPSYTAGGALSNYPKSPYYEMSWTQNSNANNWPNAYYNYATNSNLANLVAMEATTSSTLPAYYLTENTQENTGHPKGTDSDIAIEGKFLPAAGYVTQGPYAGSVSPYNDTIKFVGNVFSVPASRANTAPFVTASNDTLYQVRGGRGTVSGIPDSMFFSVRNTAYQVAYLINCANQGLTSQLNNFNSAQPEKLPTGFVAPNGANGTPILNMSYDKSSGHYNNNVAMVLAYYEGKCYYRIVIKDDNTSPKVGVKRNHYYKFDITKFKGIGEEQIDDLNYPPEDPDEQGETYVTASLTIEAWRNVSSSVIPE